MDSFNQLLRAKITGFYLDIDSHLVFKGHEAEKVLSLSKEEKYALKRKPWSCGESASRLCELLVGNRMTNVTTSGYDCADSQTMAEVYTEMMEVGGHLMARINLVNAVAGHAFIFVSRHRKPGSPLEGYLYQTNVGIAFYEFDLADWVKDEKSSELVWLPGFLAELVSKLTPLRVPATPAKPALTKMASDTGNLSPVYQHHFMPSGKRLPDDAANGMDAARGEVRLLWKTIDVHFAKEQFAVED